MDKTRRASHHLDLLHTDLCGPMKTETFGGSRYFLLFIDNISRMSWAFFLKAKSETFEHFKKNKLLVKKQSGRSVKTLRTDRRGEFLSQDFTSFCENHAMQRELTAPYTPEQNGVAEYKNRTILEVARSLMNGNSLSKMKQWLHQCTS